MYKTSQNSDKSLKFIENSNKIKTNLQYVENNWKSRIKTILSSYKSWISYEVQKNQVKILEKLKKTRKSKKYLWMIQNQSRQYPKDQKRYIKTQTKSRTFHKVQKDP